MVLIYINLVVFEALYCRLLHSIDVSISYYNLGLFLTSCSNGLSHIKIRIMIAYIAIGVTYLVVIATILGACQPFNHYWQINPNPGGRPPATWYRIHNR
jgi:hypothetical protein